MYSNHYLLIWFVSESVKDAAGHLTEATVARHSQMVGLGKTLNKVYDTQFATHVATKRKTGGFDRTEDVRLAVSKLTTERFFQETLGRHHSAFPNFIHSTAVHNPTNMHRRIMKLTKKMAKTREIILRRQNEL
jgi:hypothetical protein